MKDKSRYSKASKERMMKLTPEERKAHMSMMAKKLWSTRTPEQRSEYAKKMVRAKVYNQVTSMLETKRKATQLAQARAKLLKQS